MDLTGKQPQEELDRLKEKCDRATIACHWMWRVITDLTDQAQREGLKLKLEYLLRQELGENERFVDFSASCRVSTDDKFVKIMLGELEAPREQ